VFGPFAGICYALLGSLLNAWVLYEIGRAAAGSEVGAPASTGRCAC
jgi:uncharacterized membrane protein YdjX (TVP38/TMEM64 family)